MALSIHLVYKLAGFVFGKALNVDLFVISCHPKTQLSNKHKCTSLIY